MKNEHLVLMGFVSVSIFFFSLFGSIFLDNEPFEPYQWASIGLLLIVCISLSLRYLFLMGGRFLRELQERNQDSEMREAIRLIKESLSTIKSVKEQAEEGLGGIAKGFLIFFVGNWQEYFLCPECGSNTLDLATPTQGHPILCTTCHMLFDLVSVGKETNSEVVE